MGAIDGGGVGDGDGAGGADGERVGGDGGGVAGSCGAAGAVDANLRQNEAVVLRCWFGQGGCWGWLAVGVAGVLVVWERFRS